MDGVLIRVLVRRSPHLSRMSPLQSSHAPLESGWPVLFRDAFVFRAAGAGNHPTSRLCVAANCFSGDGRSSRHGRSPRCSLGTSARRLPSRGGCSACGPSRFQHQAVYLDGVARSWQSRRAYRPGLQATAFNRRAQAGLQPPANCAATRSVRRAGLFV